ncbi:MAG: DUF1638 domain-containing protein [Deltaproteobacteria bacterium]|nr:DUF1638 domain-containing protein [Deltaproteobacteria bacterium]
MEDHFSRGIIEAFQQNSGIKPRTILYMQEYSPQSANEFEVLVRVMEVGLHTVIKKLRDGVVKAAVEMGPYVDAILLGYGLCGNALEKPDELFAHAGLPVFLPMETYHPVDDCVGLMIGGRENYYEEQCKLAGTFFMNSGFTRHWKTLIHKDLCGEIDLAMSKRLMANYERSLLLPTPVMSEDEMASHVEEFNELYGLRTEVRSGSLELLEKSWEHAKAFVKDGRGPTK